MNRLAALALILGACNGCHPLPSPGPLPPQDAGPAPVASCATACDNARAHGFSYALPTTMGATCEAVCQNAQDFGDKWNLACRTKAQTQADADGCD